MKRHQPGLDWGGADRAAGVDEAGRGPLAGPVVAAAVILDPARPIAGIRDSKIVPAHERNRLAEEIRQSALAWAVAWADVPEIDLLNILEATHLAMRRALLGLRLRPDVVMIDGNRLPSAAGLGFGCRFEPVVDGDATVIGIAAASILAKVARDRMMCELDRLYPAYGFAMHKGYATPAHLRALTERGGCPVHRRSFAPLKFAPGLF